MQNPYESSGSFMADLHRMARWLKECGIKTVVMQSTGGGSGDLPSAYAEGTDRDEHPTG
jgi:hypothetical protein